MNLSTILICIVLIVLFAMAIRFLVKNGTCAVCVEKKNCHSAKADAESDISVGCGGKCAGCHYCLQKAVSAKH